MGARIDPRKLTRELLAFDTVNPPGMERACARHLGALLEAAGFRTEYHEYAEGRTSLIARGSIAREARGRAHQSRRRLTTHFVGVRLPARQSTAGTSRS